ncbi:hypothetical protein CMESO_355 (nucleomorph) [Chroomonas mesostigmatica CCMP1168]|uniref:Uncharacterized protein n=1 Tax=Chroomonas mesostigmatica CCMP1168 TaxID=1195612 RepID=J7G214_9CRYP|nr:hypothetical protein CMESO_355 [Chroomonas mesostigmatica CCMP1168]|mmetsp:Transcript_52501/g.128317  ORF Transcript_52501/g.128317 Transcript_52501/m.128317 type:complete len:124 (-) Transcript_52501:523-894(-)
MSPKKFKEIKNTNSLSFFNKFIVKIIGKENIINIKKKKQKTLSIWKVHISDQSGIIELFCENAINIQKGNVVEISNLKVFYYRGKIKLLGSMKLNETFYKNLKFEPHYFKKNSSVLDQKKDIF